jgi:hypothetical protein
MDGSIVLRPGQRKLLLDVYRRGTDPSLRLRANLLLLLASGQTWLTISLVLFCSTATIARWKKRFEQGGIEAVLQSRRGQPAIFWAGWAVIVDRWVRDLRSQESFTVQTTSHLDPSTSSRSGEFHRPRPRGICRVMVVARGIVCHMFLT